MNYYIGQKLWFVPRNGTRKEIEIIKIGRKYLECKGLYHQKILIKDLTAINPNDNSCYYDGQAYLSKEHYEKELQRKDAANILWYEIDKIRNKLSMEHIEKIWDILKEVDNG